MLFSSLRPSSAYLCWRLNLSQHGQPAFQRPYFPDGGSLLILRQWKHINSFSQCTISPRRITRSVEEEQPLCRSFLTRPRIGHSDDFLFGTMYRRCTPAGLWFRISSYICVAFFALLKSPDSISSASLRDSRAAGRVNSLPRPVAAFSLPATTSAGRRGRQR
jgi:hypothetical protein